MKVVTEVPDDEWLNVVTLERDDAMGCVSVKVNNHTVVALTDGGIMDLYFVDGVDQADMPGMQFDDKGFIKVRR